MGQHSSRQRDDRLWDAAGDEPDYFSPPTPTTGFWRGRFLDKDRSKPKASLSSPVSYQTSPLFRIGFSRDSGKPYSSVAPMLEVQKSNTYIELAKGDGELEYSQHPDTARKTFVSNIPDGQQLLDGASQGDFSHMPLSPTNGDISSDDFSGTSVKHIHTMRRRAWYTRPLLSKYKSEEHLSLLKTPASISRRYLLVTGKSESDLSSPHQKSIRFNSLSARKSNESLFRKRRRPVIRKPCSLATDESPALWHQERSPSSPTFLWSPISIGNDIYRARLLRNPHYCTYGCPDMSFNRKLSWIQHEEAIHEPPVVFTCRLHISDDFCTDPCPAKFCVSTMDTYHLAHFHDAFTCFDRTPASIERYQCHRSELLLKHLVERHNIPLDSVPDNWVIPTQGRARWRCGFCGGFLYSWKERGDHISIHFTREGFTMKDWLDDKCRVQTTKPGQESLPDTANKLDQA